MANNINKIAQLYNDNFGTDWIEAFDWSSAKEKESFASCNRIITKFQEKSFIWLAQSALSGEYLVRNLIPSIEELPLLKEYPPTIEGDSVFKQEIYNQYKVLDNELSNTLIHYRAFISLINTKTETENHKYIVNAYSIDGDDNCSIQLYKELSTFIYPLCKIDHLLSYNEKTIRNLVLMRVDLEKIIDKYPDEISKLFKIVLDKCSFLLKKLIYFKGKSEYVLNFKVHTIENDVINVTALQLLNDNFIFLHEDRPSAQSDNILIWQAACHKRKAKFYQMILLMNKYKNFGSEKQIDNLLKDFERYYRSFSPTGDFDKYAIKTIKNYLYNCRLSFLFQNNKLNYSKTIEEFQSVERIQIETDIQNFFPYFKTIEKLIEIIKKDIKTGIDTELLNQEISTLETLINKFEEKLSWSEENKFYPFQLPYSECRFRIESIVLFIPSSFNKPINYEKINVKYSIYKTELQTIKSEISFYNERKEIEKLKNEVSATRKNNIEIISGFTAAITFLFGCVNIFSENKNTDIKLLITNISALGILLLLFCSTIHLLTIPKDESLKTFFNSPKSILFAVMTFGYLYLLYRLLI